MKDGRQFSEKRGKGLEDTSNIPFAQEQENINIKGMNLDTRLPSCWTSGKGLNLCVSVSSPINWGDEITYLIGRVNGRTEGVNIGNTLRTKSGL